MLTSTSIVSSFFFVIRIINIAVDEGLFMQTTLDNAHIVNVNGHLDPIA